MLIDTVDINNFNAKLLKVDIQSSDFENESEWLKGSLTPTFFRNNISFKKVSLELMVEGENRDDAQRNISNLISKLICPVTLTIDGYRNKYISILEEKPIEKTISKKIFFLNLKFKSYEAGSEIIEIANRVLTKNINVVGNEATPCILEIIPSVDIIDITLEGLADDPILIKNLKANKKIILDGENQTVTVDGVNRYGDTEMWDFPSLKPGANAIKISKSNCDIKVRYKPRFI